MNPILPVQRIRLELDRMVRERPFFARVIGGRIDEEPYLDLILQMGALVDAFSPEAAPAPGAVVRRRRSDRHGRRSDAPRPVCAPAALFHHTALTYAPTLSAAFVADVGFSVLGTSWVEDAVRRLSARSQLDTGYLEGLALRGQGSYQRVREKLATAAVDVQHTYGFAELVRGAFLGVATYLDSTWPAPLLRVRVI